MRKFYAKFFASLVALLLGIFSYGQVSLTATAGTAAGTFTTLKAAFDAINAGTHQGAIVININANTTETASAVLNASGSGAAIYTSVMVKPTATATVSGTVDAPLIDLNGAKNVTIDGRINNTGSTRSLTLVNLSTSGTAGTSTIRMINSTATNTITYANINGSSVLGSTGLAATILIDSSLTGTGNNNITISNNDIGAAGTNTPSVAIYSAGESATMLNANVTVSNNLIHDYFNPAGFSAGVVADLFSDVWTINGNSFYQTAARTSTAAILHASIYVNDGNGHTVNNNFIGGGAANAGGTATTIAGGFSNRYFGMLFSVGTTTASVVNGNTITNINISSTPAASANVFTGIEVDEGNVNIGVTAGNTIGSLTGTGAITLNISGANTSFNNGIMSFTEDVVNVRNNNIGSISVTGSATGTVVLRGIEAYAYASLTVDGNTIGGTTASSIQTNTANNQMGGIFMYQYQDNTTSVANNNIIRNFTNNATGVNAAVITGINTQMMSPNILVVNTVTNNQISSLSSPGTSATVGSVVGISIAVATAATNASSDGNYNNNTISGLSSASTAASFAVRGIQNAAGYTNYLNINNNTIHTITAAAPNTGATSAVVAQGISSSTSGAGAVSMEGNTIYNIEATASGAATAVVGLAAFYGSTTNTALISKNKIYDLRNPNASATGFVSAIVLRGASSQGTFNVINNMVSISPANVTALGIVNNATALAVNAFYNSVYIGGTATGANNSAAFFRLGVPTAVTVRNNIFYNVRTGGTGLALAIANTNATPATGWSSDYNNLYSTTAANIALWGAAPQDLAAYKAASGDVNSKSVTVTFANAATGDLHLSGASTTDANLNGAPISGITVDIDNDTRSTTTPKMGADEPVLVCVAPAITTQPAAVAACTGNAANFSVTATGTSLTYQWRKGTTNIAGATNATYSIAAVVAGDAGDYNVVITNTCGNVTSQNATLTVTAGPSITTQPAATTVCSGSTANFSVTATGTGTLTYQWRKDGADIAGATNATYSIAAATAANAGSYTVRVSAGSCSIVSNAAVLTITPVTAITTQPAAVTTCLQQNATFTVVATGGAGLTYQWRKDGTNIAGATSATYVRPNVTAADAGNYSVVVTGPGTGLCGSVTSNNALLTISGPCTSIPNVDADITSVKLMPSVVNHATTLRVNAGRSMNINWNIVDMNGKVVKTFNSQVLAGQNDIQVILSNLGAGTYQIMGTSTKGRTEVIRLIKL